MADVSADDPEVGLDGIESSIDPGAKARGMAVVSESEDVREAHRGNQAAASRGSRMRNRMDKQGRRVSAHRPLLLGKVVYNLRKRETMTMLNTTDDLLRATRQNPEFRAAFQRELLTDSLLAMPARFDDYDKATDKKLDALTDSVKTLTDAVTLLTERLDKYTEGTNRRLNHMENDISDLKSIGLENWLYNRGVSLTAAHVGMYDGTRIKIAKADANSAEFNGTLYSARRERRISQDQYERVLATDMIIGGKDSESDSPIYAVIEATYSVAVADLSKVCSTAAVIRGLFPEAEVKPVLYYLTPNERMAGEASDQGVTLVRATTIRP